MPALPVTPVTPCCPCWFMPPCGACAARARRRTCYPRSHKGAQRMLLMRSAMSDCRFDAPALLLTTTQTSHAPLKTDAAKDSAFADCFSSSSAADVFPPRPPPAHRSMIDFRLRLFACRYFQRLFSIVFLFRDVFRLMSPPSLPPLSLSIAFAIFRFRRCPPADAADTPADSARVTP